MRLGSLSIRYQKEAGDEPSDTDANTAFGEKDFVAANNHFAVDSAVSLISESATLLLYRIPQGNVLRIAS